MTSPALIVVIFALGMAACARETADPVPAGGDEAETRDDDTGSGPPPDADTGGEEAEMIDLPEPRLAGEVTVEEALSLRRSVRSFTGEALSAEELSQLLWAAQGFNRDGGRRTAPSAGAKYPMEIYVATAEHLARYHPDGHRLEITQKGDLRPRFDGLAQSFVTTAPAVFVVTGVYARTAAKYGDRAVRYVRLEAGHVAQNILLQAVAIGLGGTPVGAFADDDVIEKLGLPPDHAPLYLLPVGRPAE